MPPFTFTLPDELSAKEPPERRGLGRDQVRLLVIERKSDVVSHAKFEQLGEFLRTGDLLVFNSSRTLPAALEACCTKHGPCIQVRLAQHLPDDSWLALLVCKAGDPFGCGLRSGMQLEFTDDLAGEVFDRDARIPRLWKIRFSKTGTELIDLIYRIGEPVRYEYVSAPWDLSYYQTVYAKEPGSAEMPSAGRAFTWKSLFDLRRRGIDFAYLILHTGLSSYLDDELDRTQPASEEEYFLSEAAGGKINATRECGDRVIAVGTTVVRALESIADANGRVLPAHGYTRLHIAEGHELKAVDGLLTGLHEPKASHLDLLSAFAPAEKIHAAYNEAIQQRYLWHEFGDLNLIL
ncbi:MAG TPA: S-adenosylmethionine:tRNA ribosyltransferase-isomerase [Chthoniobacterales bacterium]|nr:S-adenosylmethionine:tRNA ribosyltransferase-isomerase [Chthoniobacterales bacterium]